MKIKKGFMLREVAGNYIVVAVGDALKQFNGMINLNESGAFLWERLIDGGDEQSLVKAMLDEYDVDKTTAQTDVKEFIEKLTKAGLVE